MPSLRQIARHRLGQADLRRLRDVVARAAARLAPVHRRDHDDDAAAARAEVRERRARHAQRREQVAVQHRLQIRVVGGGEVARARSAHVVDDHVEPAVRTDGRVDDGGHAGGRRHIGRDADGRAVGTAARPRLTDRGVEVAGFARAEDDARALSGERERDSAAEPAARAGDEGDLVLEREIHGGNV